MVVNYVLYISVKSLIWRWISGSCSVRPKTQRQLKVGRGGGEEGGKKKKKERIPFFWEGGVGEM